MLTGAAAATAAAILIRAFLGGPLGILLTGASVASLVAVFLKRRHRIWPKVKRMRALVAEYEGRFEELQADARRSQVRLDQEQLMLEGLVGRFLADLDDDPDDEDEDEDAAEERQPAKAGGGFAAHVRAKRAEEELAEEGRAAGKADDVDEEAGGER